MSFFDRIKDVATGLWGAGQAPLGLAYDIIRSPFVDSPELDGTLSVLTGRTLARGAQVLGNLFGPEEGVGALIGAIPQEVGGVRIGLRENVSAAFEGLETAGTELIRDPLTTIMLAGALADSPSFGGRNNFLALADPRTWRTANRMAQTTSFGQSFALAIGTKDILDQREVQNFQGTDAYRIVSGTTDAMLRLFLDVDVALAKLPTAVRVARGTTELGTFRARVPVQLGRRPLGKGDALPNLNRAISEAVAKLPDSIKPLFVSRDVFTPADVPRLVGFEVAELRAQARRLARSGDPQAQAVARSMEARARRIETGQAPADVQRIAAEAFQRDINAFFTAPRTRRFLDRADFARSPQFGILNNWIDNLPDDIPTRAGMIRDRVFANHHAGDTIAHFLAEAPDAARRASVLRVFMGDFRELERLQQTDYALARRLEDLMAERATIRSQPTFALRGAGQGGQLSFLDDPGLPVSADHRNYSERLERIGDELNAVEAETVRNARIEAAFNTVSTAPRVGSGTFRARDAIKSSSLYQTSAWGRPLRLILDHRPHHIINLADPNADAQVARMLTQAGWDERAVARARGQFMAAPSDARGIVFDNLLQSVERKLMREHGLSKSEVERVLAMAEGGKREARSIIQSAKYDADGRARVRFHDGDEMVEMPLLTTQLADTVPVTDFRRLRRALEKYARLKHGEDWRKAIAEGRQGIDVLAEYGREGADLIMGVWKPSVLLRPAWTFRVVGDEQMRMMTKFGVLAVATSIRDRVNNLGARLAADPAIRKWSGIEAGKLGRGAVAGAIGGGITAGPFGAGIGALVGFGLLNKLARIERRGYDNLTVNGLKVMGAFGVPGDKAELFRSQASASSSMRDFFTIESRLLKGLRANPYEWRTLRWGESERGNLAYVAQWATIARRHFAQDAMARQFLEGKTAEEVLDWLTGTRAGRLHAARVPFRRDHQGWVEAVEAQVRAYTGNNPDVARKILDLGDDLTAKQARKLLDEIPEAERAPIHGPELDQILGRGRITEAIKGFVESAFNVLGTMATDELSRYPAFSMFYQSELRRTLSTLPPGRVKVETLRNLETSARRYALTEVRDLLYDLAERSEFHNMTRLLMPFAPAFQEVLTRWVGLAWENPVVLAVAPELFNAPNRAGMVYTDDQGEEFVMFRIPGWAKALVNTGWLRGAVDSQGFVRLDKEGFNLVAQGTPGFGPFVQAAVSEAVKQRPELEEAVRFIIPFGPQTGLEAFLPPAAKRALSLNEGDENRAFASARNRILVTRLVDMELGRRPMIDLSDPTARSAFIQEVNDEARQFFQLRLVAAYVSPVAPIFDSPYQAYLDVYRALRARDEGKAAELAEGVAPGGGEAVRSLVEQYGDDADGIFLDLFGEEFFAITQSFTRTRDGVPPTVEGLQVRDKFRRLIEAHPEWGGVIIGTEGGGEAVKFSRAAYDRQLSEPLRSGAAERQRERLSAEQIVTSPDARLGWTKYSRYMDMIENLRVQAGLPNLRVAAAEPLRRIKSAIITGLAAKHPAWWREFETTDRGAWHRRIEGAWALVEDSRLQGRADIRGMADYLRYRDLILGVLAQRDAAGGSADIEATSNADVANLWASIVAQLVERNPAFGDVYARKLERDPLEPGTTRADLLAA